MDLAYALRTLRKRWWWVLIGALPAAVIALSTAYHIGTSGLHRNSLEYGAAQTQLLVDSPNSSLSSATADIAAMIDRATVFAQFFQTAPVMDEVNRIMHTRNGVAVTIPTVGLANSQILATPGTTNAALLKDKDALQLQVEAQQNVPLISIYAQGPNAKKAEALANAAAKALSDYVASLKTYIPSKKEIDQVTALGQSPPSRVIVRQLGTAQGGMVDSGAGKSIVALTFIALLIVDCVIVIVLGGLQERRRLARRVDVEVIYGDGLIGSPERQPAPLKASDDFSSALTAARE